MENVYAGDYVVVKTKKGVTWAGSVIGELDVNNKNGILVSLNSENRVALWCEKNFIEEVYISSKNVQGEN